MRLLQDSSFSFCSLLQKLFPWSKQHATKALDRLYVLSLLPCHFVWRKDLSFPLNRRLAGFQSCSKCGVKDNIFPARNEIHIVLSVPQESGWCGRKWLTCMWDIFLCFFLSASNKLCVSALIRLQPLPSSSFPIHHTATDIVPLTTDITVK